MKEMPLAKEDKESSLDKRTKIPDIINKTKKEPISKRKRNS